VIQILRSDCILCNFCKKSAQSFANLRYLSYSKLHLTPLALFIFSGISERICAGFCFGIIFVVAGSSMISGVFFPTRLLNGGV